MNVIEIDYKPRMWAEVLHETKKRYICLVLHRRAGKTTAILNHLQRDALLTPGSQFAYIGPTYTQTKLVAWKIAKKMSETIQGVKYNATAPYTITYPNGSMLYLLGAENPDSLRGIALWGVAFDEYPQQPSNIFSEIISKALADHLGYAIFFGTPKGKNEFFKIYENAKDDPDWLCVFKTIEDSLRDEEGETIENLRQALEDDKKLIASGVMSEDEFKQEWYCSFESAVKGAYYGAQLEKMRDDGRVKLVPYDPAIPVHTVSDLGIGPKFVTGFYQKVGSELHKIDYWEGEEKDGIPQFVKMLQTKPYVYGKHFAPHDITATEIASGKTRIQTAQELGIHFDIVPDVGVDEGIDRGRIMMAHLWVDKENCVKWLDTIGSYQQAWDKRRGMFLPKAQHNFASHAGDEHRYAGLVEDEMTNEQMKVYKQPEPEKLSIYQG